VEPSVPDQDRERRWPASEQDGPLAAGKVGAGGEKTHSETIGHVCVLLRK
jgi:hypothetical protein